MPAAGTMYLTTSTGYPYTYHNGVAYFHTPEVASVPPPWPVSNFILEGFPSITIKFFISEIFQPQTITNNNSHVATTQI